nr:LIM domain and actin-binding protein 1 isoform X14 [Halyomorpha halys]
MWRKMAEVAKSVVREESPGGGEEEDDGPSLGEMIQAELLTLGGGWSSADSGWSTVEEVAKGIVSPLGPQATSSPQSAASPQATSSPQSAPSPQATSSPQSAPSPQASSSPSARSPSPPPNRHENGQLTSNSVQLIITPTSPPASPLRSEAPVITNGHVEEVGTDHAELVEDCAETVHEEVSSCVESVLEEVIEQTVKRQVVETVQYEVDRTVQYEVDCTDQHLLDLDDQHNIEVALQQQDEQAVHHEVEQDVQHHVEQTVLNHVEVIEHHQSEENEVMESVTTVTEKKKKKKSLGGEEGGEESVTVTKKKTKKSKKAEGKENHISIIQNGHKEEKEGSISPSSFGVEDDDLSNVCVKDLKSSFSKFDQLSKKTVLHVRSSDPAKAQKTFSQGTTDGQVTAMCKACEKAVFAMEQIKAERAVWHKNCFRCHTCNKQLTVDIYQSHEGELYCKPHFRELFKPKVVLDEEEPVRRRKPEMIIRENQPLELPPEVVRASDKPDLGLEELGQLNVKSRFQVFEKHDQTDGELERSPTTVSVKRSSSILSKLAKFQKKGMDIGVTDDSLNGFVYVESSSSEEEEEDEEDEEGEEKGVVKCRRKARERPVSFSKMDDVKRNWESVQQSQRREEMREERKQELQQIRSRLFQGKQGKMKELYEQAVAESEKSGVKKEAGEEIVTGSERAKVVRERFEKGDTGAGEGDGSKKAVEEDMAVFEEGISKKSRNIFLEMEAAAKSNPVVPGQHSPARTDSVRRPREAYYKREVSQCEDVVRSSDKVEDVVVVETADLSTRFKFFETYKEPEKQKKAFRITPPREGQVKTESPEREVYRDPEVVRCDDKLEDESAIKKSQTASRMLSMFRQLEEQKEVLPDGPKPKKCFTPPPDYKGSESSEDESGDEEEESEEEEEESETEEGVVKSSYKVKDEFLEQAKHAAKAKELAAKFECWEPEKQSTNNAINMLDSEHASIESTKSLKARFESLQNEQPKEKNRPKVNRFVELPAAALCAYCDRKVYPLERIETNGKIFHKGCFRCSYCNCILRMDTYTLNNGHLYCLPHFKQLFISKGNYDEGFGTDQHKRKWEHPVNGNTSS